MNKELLNTLFSIRTALASPRYDKGELSGKLSLSSDLLEPLQLLNTHGLVDDILVIDGKSIQLSKVDKSILPQTIDIVVFTKNLQGAKYYETLNEFISRNQTSIPLGTYCIYRLNHLDGSGEKPEKLVQYETVVHFISLLEKIADYIKEDDFEDYKELIFFHKKKLSFTTNYNENNLRNIPYLTNLEAQLESAHDREERVSIFKSELITSLYEVPIKDRFSHLLANLDSIYDSYLKSHLLYLEKFSYHDLKRELDDDKLDFTKKIYGVVNDIQSKLIAVPAAYLLVLTSFDFSGDGFRKNLLITVGALFFAVLLQTLLSNQFGILKFIEKEINHFTNELSNKDTKLNLSDFVKSFGDLNPLINKQRCYLWIFGGIIWLVPILCYVMLLIFRK